MPDRTDNSQYPTETTGDVFVGDTTIDNTAEQVRVVYPDPNTLISYPQQLEQADVLASHPGRFFTAKQGKVRPYVEYRNLPNASGIIKTGDGYLVGVIAYDSALASPNVEAVIFHDGTDSNAPIIFAVQLTSVNSFESVMFPVAGVRYRNGIYVEYVGNQATLTTVLFLREELHE